MRQAGRITALVLQALAKAAKPGLRTDDLDHLAEEELTRHGAKAAFKGYRGYPASICVSVDDELVHGIPGPRQLKAGQIVSLDLGAAVDGMLTDAAITVGVGEVSPAVQKLLNTTQTALSRGIAQCRLGKRLGDISAAIQEFAEANGYSVVREYAGHGVGRELHEDPQVPNFGQRRQGLLLRRGMTLALEPMVNMGGWQTRQAENGWTVLTADGSLCAHFEHTVAITDGDAEVLTAL